MKGKSKLSLFCLAIIVTLLAGCGGLLDGIQVDFKPEGQTNISTQEALKLIKETMLRKGIKVTFDGITISPEVLNDGFYYPFNNSQKLPIIYNWHSSKDPEITLMVCFSHAGKTFNLLLAEKQRAMQLVSAVYVLNNTPPQERQRERDDCLRVIRNTPINVILSGATAEELPISCEVNREPAESILNDVLIEWKNKGLREHLQKSSSSQLSDLVINMEKGIFNLDLKAKKLNDLADADARQVQAPGQAAPAKTAPTGALATAHLLDQRKSIFIAILGLVRQAAAQRASGG